MNALDTLKLQVARLEASNRALSAAPPAHTHAASAIVSGTLVHERGGLEADVSAYAGLVKIASGTTSAVTVTSAGEALLDDADAAAQRTTLGLGTLATQSGTFSGTSSGTNTGDQSSVVGLPTGTSPPGSPAAGMQYYDTTDDTVYTYDATRGHWFGPPITLTLGNSGAVSPGYMRFGNNAGGAALGWYVPYNVTVTEAQFNNSNTVTATLEMRVGGASQGTLTITGAASASATNLDIDLASGGIFCPYITATVGTPTNCSVVVTCKRRKS